MKGKGRVSKDGTTEEVVVYTLNSISSDYKRYIPKSSEGLTNIGRQYINQSIEAFVYSILGAQANTRVSILSETAGSLETQQEFRKLVEDSVVNYDVSTWILNMNKAIMDTNVTQNLALSPSTWLIPGGLIILKRRIPGYNNILKTATKGMKLGLNDGLNYQTPVEGKSKPKKVHHSGGNHLETLDLDKEVKVLKNTNTTTVRVSNDVEIPVLTSVVGFLISRYMFFFN